MLSSRFLAVSCLYLFYATGLVAADPGNQFGGGEQFCQSVRTVTVTVSNNQPPPSSRPANNASPPPPVVTQRPGNVNLGNGNQGNGNNNPKNGNTTTSSVNKNGNTKPSSVNKNGNTKPSSVNKNGNTKPSSVNKNNNTKNGNTKTSSTVLPTTALPPVPTNNRSFAASPSSTAAPPANTNTGNPDTSLTLDPSVIQNVNGKAQGAGQVDSLVSPNNFMNFCVGKTITNGKQIKTGSCNPTPMGDIPSVDNMPSVKFNNPRNFDTIPANTPFTIALQVNNLNTGTFTDPASTYFAAPQPLVNGIIKGHSHVTVQQMTSLDSTQPLDPKVFAFFKGLNDPAKNGVLSVDVTKGLPAGVYRVSSIVAAGNHQEAVGPVAQRGSFNDVVYITVSDGGQNVNAIPSSSIPPVDSTSSTVLPTSVSSDVPSSSVSSPAVSSSSSIPPTVSSTTSSPVPTETGGKNGNGKNNDVSSSELPVSTSTGGNSDPTSAPFPETTTPAAGNDKTDTKGPAVPSSAPLPDSTPKGGKDPQGGNGPKPKRMHKRLALPA